jgi:hypothetical protein
MARPQVADGGDDLQIWRAAADILNKQSRTADRDVPPAWGLGGRLTTPHQKKKKLVTKIHKKPRAWTDFLDKRPKRKKMDTRFGTWKDRSMYRAGALRTVAEEVSKYKLDLVGVQEVR